MPSQDSSLFALQQIITEGIRQPELPLTVDSLNNLPLQLLELLRLVPGKRAVFKARYAQQLVIAKIFTPAAQRQFERELNGYARIKQTQLRTPAQLGDITFNPALKHHLPVTNTRTSKTSTAQWSALLYTYHAAPTLGDLWREDGQSAAQRKAMLRRALHQIAHMHNQGIWQSDLHLDNFLTHSDELYIIDLSSIETTTAGPVGIKQSIDNLGLFIAQFGLCEQQQLLNEMNSYWQARCVQIKAHNRVAQQLQTKVEAYWASRRRQLLKKLKRNTTQIYRKRGPRYLHLALRQHMGPEMQQFLNAPDAFIASGTLLKDGNSSTVVAHSIDAQPVVIKRYQYKSLSRLLRRCWRQSRGLRAWRYGHYLQFCKIDTPKPLALLEQRRGPFTLKTYLICAQLDGEDLAQRYAQTERLCNDDLAQLNTIFDVFTHERIVHGDFKASNLIYSQQRIHLIDLDAITRYKTHFFWRLNRTKDLQRLRQNWSDNPAIQAQLKQFDVT